MYMKKRLMILVTGLVTSIIGILLRLNANGMAWPASYSYGGAREDTVWAIKEQIYNDIGTTLMFFGLALIFMVFMNILWTKENS